MVYRVHPNVKYLMIRQRRNTKQYTSFNQSWVKQKI